MPPTLEHDFVVVGSGSSGCVLASRLARAGLKVLLVETGPADSGSHPAAQLHGAWFTAAGHGAPISELYMTEPQQAMNRRSLFAWRGRGGGGSSVVNATVYMRGRREDYKRNWSWSLEDIEASFKSVEADLALETLEASGALGRSLKNMLKQAGFLDAASSEGLWAEEGVQRRLRCTVSAGGRRRTAWEAFVNPVQTTEASHNLSVMDDAQVTRVVIEGGRAVGIEVRRGKQLQQLRLARENAEVVLCTGAFGSPKLLMLSGVGPRGHLEEQGVPVKVDSPHVGGNLQDHLVLACVFRSRKRLDSSDLNSLGIHWMAHFDAEEGGGDGGGGGSNTVSGGDSGGSGSGGGSGGARMGILMCDCWDLPNRVPALGAAPLYKPGLFWAVVRAVFLPLFWLLSRLPPVRAVLRQTVGVLLAGLAPKSRGTVRLRSGGAAAAPPAVDPGFLSHPDDVEDLWRGWQRVHGLFSTPEGEAFVGLELSPGTM